MKRDQKNDARVARNKREFPSFSFIPPNWPYRNIMELLCAGFNRDKCSPGGIGKEKKERATFFSFGI